MPIRHRDKRPARSHSYADQDILLLQLGNFTSMIDSYDIFLGAGSEIVVMACELVAYQLPRMLYAFLSTPLQCDRPWSMC